MTNMRKLHRQHAWPLWLCLCVAHACSGEAPEQHDTQAPPPAATKPAAATAPAAEPPPSSDPRPEVPVQDRMWSHYLAAITARDSLIGGHPERGLEALDHLAAQDYAESLPDAWRPHAVHVRRAAKRAGEAIRARDTETAARAIGTLGAACGECHGAMERGPEREPTGFSELDAEQLRDRMHRHGWAVERMWEGLIVPWDESYRMGAQVLAEAQLKLAEGAETAQVSAGLESVRALGAQASTLVRTDERAVLYGDLIATCAACHRAQGIELGDVDAAEPAGDEQPEL